MAKDLTAIAAEVAKALATEPLLEIAITWGFTGSPVTYYDKDTNGKIISVSGLEDVVKLDTKGSAGSLSIVLDDSDGSIRAKMETSDIQKSLCIVSQTFDGLGASSVIFTGEVATPIVWSEGQRTVSIQVVGRIESKEIGFSAETGEFDFIADEAIGKAWPLCFGSPLKVPALKLTEAVRGTSLTKYSLITLANLQSLCDAAQALVDTQVAKDLADINAGMTDVNYAVVVEDLTGATIALNTELASLLFTNSAREAELRAYVVICKELREAERNQVLFLNQLTALDDQIEGLTASRDTAQANLQEELGKSAPDASTVSSLQDEILLLTEGSAEADGIDALTVTRNTTETLLLAAISSVLTATTQKVTAETSLTTFDLTEILVKGGEHFPQATALNIIINGAKLRGSFAGQVFTITDSGLPTNSNVVLGVQTGTANEITIDDPTIQLKGQYLYFPGRGILYVESQLGTLCSVSPILYEQTGQLPAVNGNVREIWEPITTHIAIAETGVILRQHWTSSLSGLPPFASGLSNIRERDYSISVGDIVYLETDYSDLYIANLIESTSVEGVFAYRNIDGENKLQAVPSRYYTIDLAEVIAGQTSTTIRMIKPLGQYVDEQWVEEIFVSLTSSVGPNTADVLDYLVATHTNFTSDAPSLATLVAALANYPSHFALLTRLDALDAIQDIAWQARSAAYIVNDAVFYKYLATEDATVQTITESEVVLSTMEITLTETDEIVTKLVAEWQFDGAQEEKHQVVIRNNITKYGKIERKFDFFIYNIKELVTKSLVFWMFRMSNTYKILRFTSFLKTLELQTFDTVKLSFIDNYIADSSMPGIIQRATYDSVALQIEYEILVGVRAGEMTQYPFFWSANAVDAYPGPEDIYAGGGE